MLDIVETNLRFCRKKVGLDQLDRIGRYLM